MPLGPGKRTSVRWAGHGLDVPVRAPTLPLSKAWLMYWPVPAGSVDMQPLTAASSTIAPVVRRIPSPCFRLLVEDVTVVEKDSQRRPSSPSTPTLHPPPVGRVRRIG